MKYPTSRSDCETNFLWIFENFFQSASIFCGKHISGIYLMSRLLDKKASPRTKKLHQSQNRPLSGTRSPISVSCIRDEIREAGHVGSIRNYVPDILEIRRCGRSSSSKCTTFESSDAHRVSRWFKCQK